MVPAMTAREKIATAAAEPMIERAARGAARHEAGRTTSAAGEPARRGWDPVGTTAAGTGTARTRDAVEATAGPTSSVTGGVAARIGKLAASAGTGPVAVADRRTTPGRSRAVTTASAPTGVRAVGTTPAATTGAPVRVGPSGPTGVTTGARAARADPTAEGGPRSAETGVTSALVASGGRGRIAATRAVPGTTDPVATGGRGRTGEMRGAGGTTVLLVIGVPGRIAATPAAMRGVVEKTAERVSGGPGRTAAIVPPASHGGETAASRGDVRRSGSGAIGAASVPVGPSGDAGRPDGPTAGLAGGTSRGGRSVAASRDPVPGAGSPMRRPAGSGPTARPRRPPRRCPSRH
jgi:hypothetical protein